ncbi:MAG: 8-amino-7-oxononanoate synthase [Balneolaceae bacterium]
MSGVNDKYHFLKEELAQRKEKNQFRRLHAVVPDLNSSSVQKNGKKLINFCSNDYLGLASHPKVTEKAKEFAGKYGAGSTASRLVSGNFAIHENLEEKLAEAFGYEAAIIFNTGFQANSTILATLANRNSLMLADKKVHNSLINGAILSRAKLKRFHHNDYAHLENLLKTAQSKSYNRIWIITETLFSMDGNLSDLDRLIQLSTKYNALLFSDDAHAVGVFGEKGLGFNFGKNNIAISMGTFGKAFGAFGAFVGCSAEMKDYLINFCPGFIYSTALPPAIIGALDAALEILPNMDKERVILKQNIEKVLDSLRKSGFETGTSNSQIIPVILGSEEEAISLASWLEDCGILAAAIRPPTVESGTSRIRLTLTAKHTSEDINILLRAFMNWKNR